MKYMMVSIALALSAAQVHAAGKDCEELKNEIAAKLDTKGIKGYELQIVANDNVGDQKVVGSCAGGSKKITYKK